MTKDNTATKRNNITFDTNSMFMLRDLASDDKVSGYTSFKTANQSNLTPADGMRIYIKAISKLHIGITKLKADISTYNKMKNNGNPTTKKEASALLLEITIETNNLKEIVDEFIKGMAVVHELDAKDFMSLIYYRFNFIQGNLDLLYITTKPTYADEILVILERLDNTFKKMLMSITSAEANNLDDQASNNSQLNV